MTCWLDVLIPFVAGVLLLMKPEAMPRKGTPVGEVEAKAAKLRVIGRVLLGVAGLYALLAFVRAPA